MREFISNSSDIEAENIDITIDYSDKKQINIICKNYGMGLNVEEINKYILSAGYSTKTFEDEKIGNKGVVTLLYLRCKSIKIESKKNNEISTVVWDKPYEYLKNPIKENKNIISNIETIKDMDSSEYLKVTMEGYISSSNLTYYDHDIIKNYIQRYTKLGTIEPYLDKNFKSKLDVRLKGLVFENQHRLKNKNNRIKRFNTD